MLKSTSPRTWNDPLSPCVLAKARMALGLSDRCKGNRKTFTEAYWIMVIDKIVKNTKPPVAKSKIEEAKARYMDYLNFTEPRKKPK